MKRNILALWAVLLFATPLFAQVTPTHPRAVEIEKIMQRELQGMLHDILQDQPFYVGVKVTPLRRESAKSQSKESLPYYDGSEEIVDEWDDPAKTEYELMQRIAKISVKMELPSSLTQSQINDIKNATISRLSLVEGRDGVEIETKDFPRATTSGPAWYTVIAFLTLCLIALLYGGMMLWSSKRLSKSIQTIKINPPESGAAAAATPQLNAFSNYDRPERGSLGGSENHVQFQDTLRMTEVITGLLKTIHSSPGFPCLEDMILLEKAVEENSSSTGALLSEFPMPMRHKIFALTFSSYWLKALTEPGKIDSSSFELINRLARVERSTKNQKWEELLICCWRLQEKLGSLLRGIDSHDGIAILKGLPQSLSLKIAREIMPGEWAQILKPGDSPIPSPANIEKYLKTLYASQPLRSSEVLEQYKKDVELMNYLRTADPQIEKEIYGALPTHSTLFNLRPPFYRVLEADAEVLKEFVSQVNIEDWALALMNINKSQRSQIDAHFFDRQKFRFIELLRAYDRSGLSPEITGQVREKIARLYHISRPTVSALTQSVIQSLEKEAA